MIVMILYALAAAAVALLATVGYVMICTVGCEEERLHDIREAKRELDAEREALRNGSDRSDRSDASDRVAGKWRAKP